jgi:nicotinamide mononucleotide (NMN) deamidase PncC
MASGVCRLFRASIGVSTTGFAEPSVEAGISVPCAYWAIAHARGGEEKTVRQGFVEKPGLDRVAVQQSVKDDVLQALLEYLEGFRKGRS